VHHCAEGRPGSFVKRLQAGTYFGHIVEHVALELTEPVGIPTFHGKTRFTGEPGCYWVIVEYKSEKGMQFLLRTAVELVESLVRGESFPLEQRLEEARKIVARTGLGPSTRAIVDAASRRGIPWTQIGESSLVQLGFGKERKFIQAAMSSQTSAVAVDIASDKELTKALLREASIPVPRGVIVTSESEAIAALDELGAPVVIKPLNGCQGKGVSLNLTTRAHVKQAFHLAKQQAERVLVEELFEGRDYRVLVVNGKLVAASERRPAHVLGDGISTIAELIELLNQDPQRGDEHEKPLTRIAVDPALTAFLGKCGLSLSYLPQQGEIVFLRECANLSTGGTARDVTDQVHPQIAALCERAARIIGLDICGIDLILREISEPIQPGNGIVEVNAAPGLRMHQSPSEGARREAGEAIIETLYPSRATGRIPIISVTGTNGKTTITRMIGRIIADTGKSVGMTTTDGIYINGELIVKGDMTGPRSARTVLSDPAVEVAVLETARGGIVRGGLGYDWSDISVISNIRLDHIGQNGIASLDDLLYIKSLVAERVRKGGTLILNADDERLAKLMEMPRVSRLKKRVVYFSTYPHHVLIRRHLDAGGTAYLLNHGWIVEATRAMESRIIRACDIPTTLNGAACFQVANALAAVAACRAYGLSYEAIAASLASFRGESHNAGRTNLYQVAGGYVLVDYGHNPDAFTAVCRMAARWRERCVTAVIGVPGDRDNTVIEQAGRVAARGFQRVIIKEDEDLRGRRRGEVARLLSQAAQNEIPQCECRVVLEEAEAFKTAMAEMQPGELVVVFYEKLDHILAALRERGAVPVENIPDLASEMEATRAASAEEALVNQRFAQV
jgi:cyanophycin synthetase